MTNYLCTGCNYRWFFCAKSFNLDFCFRFQRGLSSCSHGWCWPQDVAAGFLRWEFYIYVLASLWALYTLTPTWIWGSVWTINVLHNQNVWNYIHADPHGEVLKVNCNEHTMVPGPALLCDPSDEHPLLYWMYIYMCIDAELTWHGLTPLKQF